MLTLNRLYSAAKNDIESYARTRADAVHRGSETRDLAASSPSNAAMDW